MRIVFINNFFNPGGSAKTALALAEKFYEKNEMRFYGFWDGCFRAKFSDFGLTKLLPSINFDYGFELIADLESFDPDIVHIFLPGAQNPSYINLLPSKAKKFITVLCEQKIAFDNKNFEKVLFLSNYSKNFNKSVDNSLVIRPSYDYNFLEKVQRSKPVLSRVSAFCRSKLLDHTFSAAAMFKKNDWVIAGEIQDQNYYKNLISTKELMGLKNLKIISNLSDSHKDSIINDCDIWHYPTSSETFCFSVLEAMAAKKPVISYKLDAVKEFFDSDEWLADSYDDMLEKTGRMISLSPAERTKIGISNYKLYIKNSSEFYADAVMKEYENALLNKNHTSL